MTNIESLNDLENICKALQDNTITDTNDCPLELIISIELFKLRDLDGIKKQLILINQLTKANFIIKILFSAYRYTSSEIDLVNHCWSLINELKLEEKLEVIIKPKNDSGRTEITDDRFFTILKNLSSLSITNMNIQCLNDYIKNIKFNVKLLTKISITDIMVPADNFSSHDIFISHFLVNFNQLLFENPNIKQCVIEFAKKGLMANFLQSHENCKKAERQLRETIKKNAATLEKLEETLNKIGEITTSIQQLEEKFPKEELNLTTSTIQKEINNLLSKLTEDLKANTINFFENAKILENQGNKNVYYYLAQYHTHYGDTQDYKKIFENLKKVTQQDIMYSKANEQIMHSCVELSHYIAIFSPAYTTSEAGEITLSPQAKKEQQKNILKFAFYARKELGVISLNNIFKEYLGLAFDTNMEDFFKTVDFKPSDDESLFEDLIFSMVTFASNLSQAAIAPVITTASPTNIISFSNGHTPKPTSPTETEEAPKNLKRPRSPSPTQKSI